MTVADYLALEPERYPWLARIEVREVGARLDLEMEFRDEECGRLVVNCEGVRNLAFKQPWTDDMRVHSLDVADVRSRQMEGIAYSITDVEQDWLSFTASTFSAHSR